jgi:deoxyribodipyrimidine photolyase-related protein
MWSKKQLNIIPNIKSKDQENRKVFKSNKALPKLPKLSSTDTKYLNSNLIKLNNFKNNYGIIDNINNYIYPVTHKSAKIFLKDFINKRFNNFGDYQDYIKKDEAFMFHSVLSSSLNIGLLNPSDIIEEVMKYKNKIPLNSFEGFIRQLFWREYQMYCYKYIDFDYYLKNYNKSSNHQSLFSYSNKLNKSWYNGTIKIDNIDMTIINDTIKKGFENAYLHHIERLMVMGNFMNIYELHPKEGFKWFMEFSIDSYEWVMYQNVYDMVFYITGLTMRKPYITTSNYVLSISDYNIKEDKEWINKWDEMFYKFLKKYKTQIQKKHSYYFPSLKKI